MLRYIFLLFPCVALTTPGLQADEFADLILTNGKIVTLDPNQPQVEALAVRGDRIDAIGTTAAIAKHRGSNTKVLDLQGKLAIPGFIEGHGHFLGFGQSLMNLDLSTAKTWDAIIERVESAAQKAPKGTWIIGRGWHQSKWTKPPEPHVDGYPTHRKLSQLTPDHPVLLSHASGHASFANAAAMQAAEITATTRPPRGGEILKDAHGQPIGVFRETAQGLVRRAYAYNQRQRSAADRKQETLEAIRLATDACLRNGITSFQDAGSSFATIALFKQLAEQAKLGVRLWVMIREPNRRLKGRLPQTRMIGVGNHHLTVRALKQAIDGALGPHGAWLLEPYEDLSNSSGLNTASVASVRELAQLALQHDYQLCIHAIGDRANRETLDIFAEAFQKAPSSKSRRWRIEHAQHLHPADIPRFAELGVIASMQGIHCTSDAIFVLKRLGHRRAMQGAYVWESLRKSGAVISNGTDVPVEDINPIACFYASVTRKLTNGTVFFAEQCMSREQALKSYTLDAAYAAFEEDLKGSLTPGKLADLVVLSRDILTVPEEKILGTRVLTTILGGKVRYQR